MKTVRLTTADNPKKRLSLFAFAGQGLLAILLLAFGFAANAQKDYQHWANTDLQWTGGDLNKQNSSYKEGDVVPHYVQFDGLQPNDVVTVSVDYDYYLKNKNAGGFTAFVANPDLTGVDVTGFGSDTYYADASPLLGDGTSTTNQTRKNVTMTFTYTGTSGNAFLVFGLQLAKPNDASDANGGNPTLGAAAWAGASLQTYIVQYKVNDGGWQNGNRTLSIQSNAINSSCNSEDNLTITSPICAGATSVSGTSSAATVDVYVKNTYVGTATVSSGTWTLSGISPALAAGDDISAVSFTSDGCESSPASATVRANTSAPVVTGPICAGATTVSGTSAAGASIVVSKTVSGTTTVIGTATADPSGNWSATVPALSAGDVITATAQASGECASGASDGVTVRANTSAPVVTGPICAGATTVSGTSAAGASIVVSKTVSGTTTVIGTATADPSGNWSATVPALSAGDVITATAQASGECASGASDGVTVRSFTTTPTINTICAGTKEVTGTAAAGATVVVTSGLQTATVTYPTSGTWKATFATALASGATVNVTASQTDKCDASASATVNPLPPCTLSATSTAIVGQTATFTAPDGNYTYLWSLSSNTAGATITNNTSTSKVVQVLTTTVGSYTLTLKVTDKTTYCFITCATVVTVSPIGPSVTYTQGFYGNNGGKDCFGKYSYQIMSTILPSGSVYFGNQSPTLTTSGSKSFKLNAADVGGGASSNIYKMLPGGTTPAVLGSAWKSTCNYSAAEFGKTCTYAAVPLSSTGSINNVLLAQTIALYFNTKYSPNLSNLLLTGNVLTFVKPTKSCGTTYPTTGGTQKTIPCTVFNYLKAMSGGATIGNLFILANKVLGGEVTSISASDVNNAVDAINKGFDGGGQVIAVSTSCVAGPVTRAGQVDLQPIEVKALTVSAFPNPFTDKIRFTIQSPKGGRASLEVYNMLGQKVGVPFEGFLNANETRNVEYTAPVNSRTNLIYTLRMNGEQVNGKLISTRQ